LDIREQLASDPYRDLTPHPPQPIESTVGWPKVRELALPCILFAATLVTTTLANGPFYGAAVLGILLCHEMGHYLMCRRYHVPSTLPYFVPLPPQISLLGTLGAVIRMRLRTGDRRIIYDIGIAGPLAGIVVAIPCAWWGLAHSRVAAEPTAAAAGAILGDSILFKILERITLGPIGPDQSVYLHPIALAGWAGLFVTALNLIPVGMLDGGHVAYGLLGRRAIWLSRAVMVGLLAMGAFVHMIWFVWAGLLLLLGIRHPATRIMSGSMDKRRITLGILAFVLFVLCFVPRPIAFTK
jgi:membrane-associated protease RseP (regulator of RpoE activity)